MSEQHKHKHFVTVVSPNGESVTVDIALSDEEYEVVNVISTLVSAEADITAPIMIVSKATDVHEHYKDGVVEED